MSEIKFSLIMPSIRPQNWKRFCDSLKDTKLNWEAIAVGDKPPLPGDKLPPNFRWINSSVKPSQATHIGFIEAKGEIVSLTADDATYFAPYPFGSFPGTALDNMYIYMTKFPQFCHQLTEGYKQIVYGFRMFEEHPVLESTQSHRVNYYIKEKPAGSYPLLYPFFAIFRELYLEVGGYDNRFITGQAENDFQMRIASKSHTDASLCPSAMVHACHELGHSNSGKFREYYKTDRATLVRLYGKLGGDFLSLVRKDREIRSYTKHRLYTKSQGVRGEWT